MTDIAKLTAADATHLLRCRHCIGGNCRDYYMLCFPIKTMPGNRLKIVVFGNLYWKDQNHIKRIRYVSKYHVTPRRKDKTPCN